jgi:hypothetical protein
MHSPSRSGSRGHGLLRSPVFASQERKDLWLAHTRGPTHLGEFDKDAVEVEIIAMADEEVTAALLSIQKDVKDVTAPHKGRGRTVTVEDVDSNEDSDDADDADDAGDTPRRSTMPLPPAKPAKPARPSLLDDIPIIPYK